MTKFKRDRYVYFLRPIGADGRIKIGCSYHPARRLVALSVWSPYPLEVVAVAPGNYDTERALHDYFAADLLHREWFRSSPALLTVIDLMSKGASFSEAIAAIEQRKAA